MLVPDVNVLFYAIDSSSPQHAPCRQWLEDALNGQEPVGWTWIVLLGFVRIGTNPKILASPLSYTEALDYIDQWLAQPSSQVIEPTGRHAAELRALLDAAWQGSNSVSDAHLASIAIEHNAQLCSCDSDFARFPGLSWFDPSAKTG